MKVTELRPASFSVIEFKQRKYDILLRCLDRLEAEARKNGEATKYPEKSKYSSLEEYSKAVDQVKLENLNKITKVLVGSKHFKLVTTSVEKITQPENPQDIAYKQIEVLKNKLEACDELVGEPAVVNMALVF